MTVEQLTFEGAMLGEGPCWDDRSQVLYWVDIWGHRVHRYDPQTGSDRHDDVGEMVGTVAPRADGRLMVALERCFGILDPETGALERLAEVESSGQTRFNDGKCDPQGRFWCGSMDLDETRPLGRLYRMDVDGTVHRMLERLTISNGIGWSPDRRTMYHIDSPERTVCAMDFDPATGQIGPRRVVVRVDESLGWPDGMTVDAEGKIWVCHWAAGCVCRWDPATGERLEQHPVPAPHTSACCFGGPELSDLYITTARKGLTEKQLDEFPQSGCLFRLTTSVRGLPTGRFGQSEI